MIMCAETAKRLLNAALAPLGLEVHRRGAQRRWQQLIDELDSHANNLANAESVQDKWVRYVAPNTVIDVGAYVGEFSQLIRRLAPNARIYAFEPQTKCFAQLSASFADDTKFQAFNIGLADTAGTLAFEINDFAPSSSFLRVAPSHINAFPHTASTHVGEARVARLDEVLAGHSLEPPLLIKLDVQGFEDRVLNGAKTILRKADVLIIETSFRELYEHQQLFAEILALLQPLGFTYQGAFDQLHDPSSGNVLQQDSIFMRHSQ
jgi:FkbM family methyltransferase